MWQNQLMQMSQTSHNGGKEIGNLDREQNQFNLLHGNFKHREMSRR